MLEKLFGTVVVAMDRGSSGSGRIAVLNVATAPVAARVGRRYCRSATRMVETARGAKGARPTCLPLVTNPSTLLVLVGRTIAMTEFTVPS